MARKSALESLNRRLEEGGDGGDTVIDITVIADSDGEAAEAIEDAVEASEAAGEAEAIQEDAEAAEQEQQDMTELAAVLRQYGLNAGMAAVINVLVPTSSLGISMPAVESLDASGRNMERAERLAAALEASGDGFWSTVKNTLKKLWRWMADLAIKLGSMIGGLAGRIERMGKTLDGRKFEPDRNKDKKYPKWENLDKSDPAICDKVLESMKQTVSTALSDNKNSQTIENIDDQNKAIRNRYNSFLPMIGLKWKEASKDDDLKLEVETDFLKTKDETVDSKALESYAKGGAAYQKTIGFCQNATRVMPAMSKLAKMAIDTLETISVNPVGTDKDSDANKAAKKRVDAMRAYSSATQKIFKRTSDMCRFACTNYLKCGRSILSCTTPTESKVEYKD